VKWIDEVLQVALTHLPVPLPVVEAKAPEAIASEKRRRRPPRVKSQVRAH